MAPSEATVITTTAAKPLLSTPPVILTALPPATATTTEAPVTTTTASTTSTRTADPTATSGTPALSTTAAAAAAAAATTTVPSTTTAAASHAHAASASASSNRDVEDGKRFVGSSSHSHHYCKAHKPTLEELQQYNFSEYVRKVVLEAARVPYEELRPTVNESGELVKVHYIEDYELSTNGFPSKPTLYAEGMAKVSLPYGFWKEEKIGKDRTGRGPVWQAGTELGDLVIPNPIRQCVRGIGGVYEYTMMDQGPITLAAYREEADAYMEQQLLGISAPKKKKAVKKAAAAAAAAAPPSGRNTKNSNRNDEAKSEGEEEQAKPVADSVESNEENKKEENELHEKDDNKKKMPTIEEMERKFWKRLGPTMPPATYGADMEGSLFGDDPASGWNLGQLDSFLQLLGPNLPGVTSPYLYMGMWASVFGVHTEDMNLLSINYLHAGAPKVWYAIAPGQEARRFEALCEHYYAHAHQDCRQFLRHKRYLLSPAILKKAGIKYTFQVQYPGDAMITIPDAYHFGFNTGFNVAEATNFGVPEWIPFGHQARICMCRPDSVRIDMFRLERLLARYRKENKKKTSRRRKSYRDWGMQHYQATHPELHSESESDCDSEVENGNDNSNGKTNSRSTKKRMKDFWVEVMAPVPSTQRADYGRRVSTGANNNKKVPTKKRLRSKGSKTKQQAKAREVWHLAKPMTRKGLVISAKVLVMIPGVAAGAGEENFHQEDSESSSDSDVSRDMEEDEQCFAGVITEFSEDHCRVHFASLSKDDDVWMHIDSNKLFLDGGCWDESHAIKEVPPRHFWQEMDSKRRCV